MVECVSDRVKGILEEERGREDFVREVTCEWVLNNEDEFPTWSGRGQLWEQKNRCVDEEYSLSY